MIVDNDLLSIQHARIMAENAVEAQQKLASFSQDKLDQIVAEVAAAAEKHGQDLAIMSQEETDSGRWQDKWVKNRFVCNHVLSQLQTMRCVGIIARDPQAQTMDIGVPVGVIVAFCPVTSPVSTTICKTLLGIKSGNAILFSPHPGAKKSIGRVLDIMIEAAEASGLPAGSIAYLEPVTKSGAEELIHHPATSLIMVTGVPGMLYAAQAAGKPVIYGGTGNGPAFIERSADIQLAVKDIIASKTFDNGLAPSAEQSIVVDGCIADDVRLALGEQGAYFMSEEESLRLAELLFCPSGRLRKGVIGLSAELLARRAGFVIPENTTILVADRRYVSDNDPYSRELLSPVLPFYVEDDWLHACEKCIELLLNERNGHTLVIHSADDEVIRQFALKKPVGRLLVNTPASFGGMGATTNLFPSMTLGSGSAGQGITSDNVSPMNLIYRRKVGYGVRRGFLQADENASEEKSRVWEREHTVAGDLNKAQALQHILTEAIKALSDPADR